MIVYLWLLILASAYRPSR